MRWTRFLVRKIGGKHLLGRVRCTSPFLLLSTSGPRLSNENIVKSPLGPITIPEMTLPQYIFEKCDQWSDRPAVACGLTGRTYTYGDVRRMSHSLAASLQSMGLEKQSVIATVLPNIPEFPFIAMAVLEAGLSLSPVNFLYTPDEMVSQLLNSRSQVIFTIPERLEAVLEAKELLKKADKDLGERVKVIVTPSLMGEEPETPQGTVALSDLTKEEPVKLAQIDNNGIAVIPYSSGTTGLPKGVCLTHRNIVANLLQARHEEINDFQPSEVTPDVVPCVLPMFHIYGLVYVALQCLSSGSKLVTLPRFEPTFFLKILTDHKASVLFAVPPMVLFLGSSPYVTKEHLASLRLIVVGAAPIAGSDIVACQDKAPQARFKQGYGLTECSPGLIYQPKVWPNFDSVGVPLSNTEIKVVDTLTGESLPSGHKGEICARGPQVMKGYLNNPAATKESIDEDGWYSTGDIGYYDDQGAFFVVDRVKELIKVKGFQVAPAELEELLRTHPAVRDAGVVGVKDPKLGERPVAFVAFHPEATPPKIDDLRAYVNTKVAPYKHIEEFIYSDNIERSPAGKILRKDLKEIYMTNHAN